MLLPSVRAPLSSPVKIKVLRPTQITLGLREVTSRAAKLRSLAKEQGDKYLEHHVIPVVKGPEGLLFIIDHHHLCRALVEAGSDEVTVTVVLNLQRLEGYAFWVFLDNRGLVHPYDENGKRCSYDAIPKSVADMIDDPYRSLAGALRGLGGYAKDTTPFSEFLWADFLRRELPRADVEANFDKALNKALALAKETRADYLPGWCGPIHD